MLGQVGKQYSDVEADVLGGLWNVSVNLAVYLLTWRGREKGGVINLPGVVGYVLGEVGEQNGDVEADVLGRTVEAVSELVEVNLAVLVRVNTHHHVVDLLAAPTEKHPNNVIHHGQNTIN